MPENKPREAMIQIIARKEPEGHHTLFVKDDVYESMTAIGVFYLDPGECEQEIVRAIKKNAIYMAEVLVEELGQIRVEQISEDPGIVSLPKQDHGKYGHFVLDDNIVGKARKEPTPLHQNCGAHILPTSFLCSNCNKKARVGVKTKDGKTKVLCDECLKKLKE